MKDNLTYKKLGEVATFINGYPFKPNDWMETGMPIIRIQNLNNSDAAYNYYNGPIGSRYIVKNGDVLISWSGTLGVYEWGKKENALLNQHIFKVVFDKISINKSYFKYAVSSRINEMKSKVHGITMQHITKGEFDKTTIPVPPLSEQSHIVSELDLLQSIIDKQQAQLKELDTLAQSIFYDMFGDPVENEKRWEKKKVSEITKYYNGIAHEQDVDENGDFILINAKFISTQGEIVKRTSKQRFPLFVDDIVMVLSDLPNGKSLGKCFLVDKNNLYSLNQRICCFRGFNGEAIFLKFVINRNPYFLSFDDGKGQTNLRKNEVENLPVIIPPLSLQQSFAEKTDAIEKKKTAINQSLAETQKLFDYTMNKYFG